MHDTKKEKLHNNYDLFQMIATMGLHPLNENYQNNTKYDSFMHLFY